MKLQKSNENKLTLLEELLCATAKTLVNLLHSRRIGLRGRCTQHVSACDVKCDVLIHESNRAIASCPYDNSTNQAAQPLL